jgi:hypothetical protein
LNAIALYNDNKLKLLPTRILSLINLLRSHIKYF